MLRSVAVNPVAQVLQGNPAQLERIAVQSDDRAFFCRRADGDDVVKPDGVAGDHGRSAPRSPARYRPLTVARAHDVVNWSR